MNINEGVWWGVQELNYKVWTASRLRGCWMVTQDQDTSAVGGCVLTYKRACVKFSSVYVWFEAPGLMRVLLCCRVSGAMANASPDLDNAEAQRQLNNNNRPISSGFWETDCTSSKLFECSRIKALAGQTSHGRTANTHDITHTWQNSTNYQHPRMVVTLNLTRCNKLFSTSSSPTETSSVFPFRVSFPFLRWTRCGAEEDFHQMG